MSNHPNRNWRRRAQAAAEAFLAGPAGEVLAEVPWRPSEALAAIRGRLRQAFLLGYEAGRQDRAPTTRSPVACEVCGTVVQGTAARRTCSDACRSRRQYRIERGLPVADEQQ